MQNNYYFLVDLVKQVAAQLVNSYVEEICSQQKDVCIITFVKGEVKFFLRATLSPAFTCIDMPMRFNRKNHNSIDLLPQLLGKQCRGYRVNKNDRSFFLFFTDSIQLFFKLYYPTANIFLLKNKEVVDSFKKNDGSYCEEVVPDPCYADFCEKGLKKTFPTFDKTIENALNERGFQEQSLGLQWSMIEEILKQMKEKNYFVFYDEKAKKIKFSLFQGKNPPLFHSKNPLDAVNFFYTSYFHWYNYEKEKTRYVKEYKNKLIKTERYVEESQSKFSQFKKMNYRQLADLLMVHLNELKQRQTKAILPDLYNGTMIEIVLNPKLTPIENVEYYYRKAKKHAMGISIMEDRIQNKKEELEKIQQKIKKIEEIEDIRSLRSFIKENQVMKPSPFSSVPQGMKCYKITYKGYFIYIGKDAKSNDALLHSAHKEDIWLHSRDTAGSHVIIKKNRKEIPSDIIYKVAQWAAYYSKSKGEKLATVIFTERKYVVKRKNTAKGMVTCKNEKIILVTPAPPPNPIGHDGVKKL